MKIFVAALICGCAAVAVGSLKEDLFGEARSMPAFTVKNKHCFQDPCKEGICRFHPEAECRIDYCKGGAAWYEGDKEVDCDECPSNLPLLTDCKDKCKTTKCPNYPDAHRTKLCRMYKCGQCTAEYFDPGSNYPLHCHGQ